MIGDGWRGDEYALHIDQPFFVADFADITGSLRISGREQPRASSDDAQARAAYGGLNAAGKVSGVGRRRVPSGMPLGDAAATPILYARRRRPLSA